MKIIVYENSLRAQYCERYLASRSELSRYNNIVILPIPTTRDGVCITGGDATLLSLCESFAHGDLVCGYGIPEVVRSSLAARGIVSVDVSLDEGFLLENARLTAEATLGIILGSEERSLSDIRFGIVGFGRIGSELLKLLLPLSPGVRVYTSRKSIADELCSLGISAEYISEGLNTSSLDILINTAPSLEFCRLCGDSLSALRIIELASGSNFPGVPSVEAYPSLPARSLPRSAGAAYAKAIIRSVGLVGGQYYV